MVKLEDNPSLTAEDVVDGEQFEIIDSGRYIDVTVERDGKEEIMQLFCMVVKLRDLEFDYIPNKTTRNNFTRKYGKDTENWVGKKGEFAKVKQNVFGTVKEVLYATPIKSGRSK
jgi:hypothetical protein